MKLFIAIIFIITTIFLLGRLSAQLKTINDLFEFNGDKITTKCVIKLYLPCLPNVTIPKGTTVVTVEE